MNETIEITEKAYNLELEKYLTYAREVKRLFMHWIMSNHDEFIYNHDDNIIKITLPDSFKEYRLTFINFGLYKQFQELNCKVKITDKFKDTLTIHLSDIQNVKDNFSC